MVRTISFGGDPSANSCRKNDATSTSHNSPLYLQVAPRNQAMLDCPAMSDNPARRAVRMNPPSQIARSSGRITKKGRDWQNLEAARKQCEEASFGEGHYNSARAFAVNREGLSSQHHPPTPPATRGARLADPWLAVAKKRKQAMVKLQCNTSERHNRHGPLRSPRQRPCSLVRV